MRTPYPNELYHHGILGQRWGVRNGPPYPLSSEEHSKSEKAAGWRKSLDSNGKREEVDRRDKKSDNGSRSKFDKKKMIRIGVAAVTAALTIYGAYYFTKDSGAVNQLVENGKLLLEGRNLADAHWNRNDALARSMSAEEIANTFFGKINPGYNKEAGTTNNCRRCTFAYEIARRGYDVRATRTKYGTGQNANGANRATKQERLTLRRFKDTIVDAVNRNDIDDYDSFFISAFTHQKAIKNPSEGDNIFTALSGMPNGARGELSVVWKVGGGHSVAWEIINGKPYIFDMQIGKMFQSGSELFSFYSDIGTATFSRLDNMDLDFNFLRRWVANDD